VHSFRSEYRIWFVALGALASSASLISLIQRLFNVGLAGTLLELLEYYRTIMYQIIDHLIPLPFALPAWYKDCISLSFFSTMLFVRALYLDFQRFLKEDEEERLRIVPLQEKLAFIQKIAPILILVGAIIFSTFSFFGFILPYVYVLLQIAIFAGVKGDEELGLTREEEKAFGTVKSVKMATSFRQFIKNYIIVKSVSVGAALVYFGLNAGVIITHSMLIERSSSPPEAKTE
jgi:hypothetical protein